MTNQKRVAALLLCVGLVFALAVSSAFIVHEAGHDCSGHDCHICQMIAANLNLLRTLGLAVLMLPAVFAALHGRFAHRDQQRFSLSASDTLVSRKIRLND